MAKKKQQLVPSYGSAIRATREKYGYSRETLAFRASISPRYLAMIELGQRNPGLDCLIAIANALGCTTDELIRPSAGIAASDTDHLVLLFEQCSDRDKKIVTAILEEMINNK